MACARSAPPQSPIQPGQEAAQHQRSSKDQIRRRGGSGDLSRADWTRAERYIHLGHACLRRPLREWRSAALPYGAQCIWQVRARCGLYVPLPSRHICYHRAALPLRRPMETRTWHPSASRRPWNTRNPDTLSPTVASFGGARAGRQSGAAAVDLAAMLCAETLRHFLLALLATPFQRLGPNEATIVGRFREHAGSSRLITCEGRNMRDVSDCNSTPTGPSSFQGRNPIIVLGGSGSGTSKSSPFPTHS